MHFKVIRTHRMFEDRYGELVADATRRPGFLWIELAPPNGKGMVWYKNTSHGPDIIMQHARHRWLSARELMIWNNHTEYIFYIEREATRREFEQIHSQELNKNGFPIL